MNSDPQSVGLPCTLDSSTAAPSRESLLCSSLSSSVLPAEARGSVTHTFCPSQLGGLQCEPNSSILSQATLKDSRGMGVRERSVLTSAASHSELQEVEFSQLASAVSRVFIAARGAQVLDHASQPPAPHAGPTPPRCVNLHSALVPACADGREPSTAGAVERESARGRSSEGLEHSRAPSMNDGGGSSQSHSSTDLFSGGEPEVMWTADGTDSGLPAADWAPILAHTSHKLPARDAEALRGAALAATEGLRATTPITAATLTSSGHSKASAARSALLDSPRQQRSFYSFRDPQLPGKTNGSNVRRHSRAQTTGTQKAAMALDADVDGASGFAATASSLLASALVDGTPSRCLFTEEEVDELADTLVSAKPLTMSSTMLSVPDGKTIDRVGELTGDEEQLLVPAEAASQLMRVGADGAPQRADGVLSPRVPRGGLNGSDGEGYADALRRMVAAATMNSIPLTASPVVYGSRQPSFAASECGSRGTEISVHSSSVMSNLARLRVVTASQQHSLSGAGSVALGRGLGSPEAVTVRTPLDAAESLLGGSHATSPSVCALNTEAWQVLCSPLMRNLNVYASSAPSNPLEAISPSAGDRVNCHTPANCGATANARPAPLSRISSTMAAADPRPSSPRHGPLAFSTDAASVCPPILSQRTRGTWRSAVPQCTTHTESPPALDLASTARGRPLSAASKETDGEAEGSPLSPLRAHGRGTRSTAPDGQRPSRGRRTAGKKKKSFGDAARLSAEARAAGARQSSLLVSPHSPTSPAAGSTESRLSPWAPADARRSASFKGFHPLALMRNRATSVTEPLPLAASSPAPSLSDDGDSIHMDDTPQAPARSPRSIYRPSSAASRGFSNRTPGEQRRSQQQSRSTLHRSLTDLVFSAATNVVSFCADSHALNSGTMT